MTERRLAALIGGALGVYAVYLLIVIARAGYETGQVLAGKATAAEAMARLDVSGALLVLGGVGLFAALKSAQKR
jgi:hypothetical protein